MPDTVTQGETVVTPPDTFGADGGIDGGTSAAAGSADALPEASDTVNASGEFVMPGLIDPRVHIDDMFAFDTDESAGRPR